MAVVAVVAVIRLAAPSDTLTSVDASFSDGDSQSSSLTHKLVFLLMVITAARTPVYGFQYCFSDQHGKTATPLIPNQIILLQGRNIKSLR